MAICKTCGKKYSMWTKPVSAKGVCAECFEGALGKKPGAKARVAALSAETEPQQANPQSSISDPQNPTQGDTTPKRGVFQALSIYLIAAFLWRALTTANEYPSRTLQVMTIALDLLGVIGLIGLKIQIFKNMPSDQSEWTTGKVLSWIALMAGLGLFAIRFNGDASWWTGHLTYDIGPHR